ncbi:arrestin domain-containing protein 3-like [Physella acuta]|uniref:arrestin domain-containing protein 3-like n=1 Tax=Physella acuta TaxID=109671 RepID=UPI0027DDAC8D|nr:arrestin domain-containing protein 3-like [Physella acuta]XP_059149720.1 arrestin domain-containing protein 3-like [Physella acuta]XP_059149721.1 arrestin domain-containing protein 3-like [Physella acuta]
MRVELFELHFSRSNSIYIAGQVVSGSVVIKLAKETWISSIDIKFIGRAKSKWDVSNGDTSKHYQAMEVYIDSEYHLYKSRSQTDNQPPGMHVYPFDFTLPTDVPSSFEGRRGYVRYQCIVTMDRGWKGVLQIEQDLTVIRHLDLSILPDAAMPQHLEREQMYEGCCCDSGNVYIQLDLQKSGFVPGEPMNFTIIVNNKATSSICGVVMSLVQTVRYTGFSDSLFSSGHPKYHDKINHWVLFQADDDIGAGKTFHLVSACSIPAVAPSLLEGCNIIDIMYEIHVEVPVGWKNVQLSCTIFIGTIPLQRTEPRPSSHSDEGSLDLDLTTPPLRQNYELPPSYEECVFGRMESQERDGEGEADHDGHTGATSSGTTASRRSRLRRLPSYPYYSTDHFASSRELSIDSQSGYPPPPPGHSGYPHPPPLSLEGYTSVPVTEQPVSSLPPPPSYESLQLHR